MVDCSFATYKTYRAGDKSPPFISLQNVNWSQLTRECRYDELLLQIKVKLNIRSFQRNPGVQNKYQAIIK